jgi:hypothetical protein
VRAIKALRRTAGRFFLQSETGNQEMDMNEKQATGGKILRKTEGIGTVTPQLIEERAREIARSGGRTRPNELDRTAAREEMTGATSNSEKPPTREEPGRDWQMPLVSTGEKAPTVRPEDDENIPDKLVQEGVEEADHDQRLRSERTRGR